MENTRPRKLVLNRETIRDLTRKDLQDVEGGVIQMTNAGNCDTHPRNCGTESGRPCQLC